MMIFTRSPSLRFNKKKTPNKTVKVGEIVNLADLFVKQPPLFLLAIRSHPFGDKIHKFCLKRRI